MTFLKVLACAAGALSSALAGAATPQQRAASESVNYVFASELGSGIYDLDGRSLQVYRLAPTWDLREATDTRPGMRLVVPATFGFFDFNPLDIPGNGLPSRIDSFSITPGLEFDYLLPRDWVMTPWVRAGLNIAEGGVNGLLYSAGLRFDLEGRINGRDFRRRHELVFSGVSYEGSVPDDRFVRLRQAAELRQGTGLHWRGQELEVSGYGLIDILLDPPAAPLAGSDGEPLRMELGLLLGTRPGIRVWRFGLPRIGLGYRLAGDFSGWHLALGTPF